MNLYLKNYRGKARLARVNDNADESFMHEELVITDIEAYFKSDGYRLTNEQKAAMNKLQKGDIVFLVSNGAMFRLFSAWEDDATIYLTGHCNSNCIMCPTSDYERQKSEGMPDAWLMEFLDMLPRNLCHALITGGEPTMRLALFFKVMSVLAARFPNTETLILSNGRSFSSNELVQRLVHDCPPMLEVAVPIHGGTPELHDAITRANGSFRQTLHGINNLLSAGIAIEIRIVVSQMNIHSLAGIAKLIIDKFPKVSVVNFIGLETRGNCALNFKELYLTHDEAFKAMKLPIKQLMSKGINVGIYNFPLCMVDSGYWDLCKKSITPEKIRYMDECCSCEAKEHCGGFFNTTLSMAKPKMHPIHFKGEFL